MSVVYLACLFVALGCMVLLDRRFRLFFWNDARRAALVLTCGLVFFLAWDLLGIAFGIFARGETEIMTGVVLAPELPLEEPVFLTFLCYLTVVLIAGIGRLTGRRQGNGR